VGAVRALAACRKRTKHLDESDRLAAHACLGGEERAAASGVADFLVDLDKQAASSQRAALEVEQTDEAVAGLEPIEPDASPRQELVLNHVRVLLNLEPVCPRWLATVCFEQGRQQPGGRA